MNIDASSAKSGNWQFDVLLLSITCKVSTKKVQKNDTEETQKSDPNWIFVWKMIWGIWWTLTRAENLHFNRLILQKVYVWAKKIQRSCVVKNDLWFQKWHKQFGDFSHQQPRVILDKSPAYNVLAYGMYFLDKRSSPSNLNFLDFPLLVWSCPNSSCDFWNQESVFV